MGLTKAPLTMLASDVTGLIAPLDAKIAFLEKNLALATLRQQIDTGWSVLKMVDGIADEFEDTTGANAGNVYQLVAAATGTASNRLNWTNVAQAFNGNYTTGTGTSGTASLGIGAMKDWGAGVTKKVHKVVIYPDATYGFSSDPTAQNGVNAYFGYGYGGYAYQYAGKATATSNTAPITIEVDYDLSANRYHWIDLYEGTSSGASHQITIAEIEFYELVGAYNGGVRYDTTGDYFTNETNRGLVPPLSANVDQGWTIATSAGNGSYPNTLNPFMLFDGSDVSQHYTWGTSATFTIDSPSAISVLSYEFRYLPYLPRMPKTWTFDGWNGSAWVTLDTRTNITDWNVSGTGVRSRVFTCATPNGPYSKHRLVITSNNGDTQHIEFNQLRLHSSATVDYSNFSVSSVVATADVQATETRLVLLHQPVSSTTLNTDCTIEVSRDGGTTWTAGTLVNEGAFDTTTNILSATVDVSAQPSGTSMKWRFNSLNNKEQRLHGVWMQWR